MFELHPQLAMDTVMIGTFPLSLVLLSKDANYPWCILVPQREGVREAHHLSSEDRQQLQEESAWLAAAMELVFDAEKMNVAALGNMVSQLHIHHIARFATDAAWPKPVWGVHAPLAYSEKEQAHCISSLQASLTSKGFTAF